MNQPLIQVSNVIEIFPKSKEEKLEEILKSYKISVVNISCNTFDNFDVYSLGLAPGVKISRLEKTLPEIGLNLKALSTPRGRVIMESGLYEISVQTSKPESFSIDYKAVASSKVNYYCPINLGKDEFGNDLLQDLNQLPNLLVAGTTGSGKSMLLHSIILSVAAKNAEIYLVDPKSVEFDIYRDLKCVQDSATDLDGAKKIMKNIFNIMQNTFATLKSKGCRNVVEYNSISKDKITPIVLIIDEWADLVLQDKKIQTDLCLIAQKGRAAGISVILATQRPSASIISGAIKANFPARIAMRVASAIDSRVILDASGAEKLAKVGSGIYLDPKTGELRQFFVPKIDSVDAEIKKLGLKKNTSFWKLLWG
mgnify:CR=1 FL=1